MQNDSEKVWTGIGLPIFRLTYFLTMQYMLQNPGMLESTEINRSMDKKWVTSFIILRFHSCCWCNANEFLIALFLVMYVGETYQLQVVGWMNYWRIVLYWKLCVLKYTELIYMSHVNEMAIEIDINWNRYLVHCFLFFSNFDCSLIISSTWK